MHNALLPTRINDKFQDPLYLFLELVRAGVMHGNLWSGRAFSGGPSFGTGEFFVRSLLVIATPFLAFLLPMKYLTFGHRRR
jgi:hypothetical protein